MNENSSSHREFYDLEVWKKARALRNEALRLTAGFPQNEKYALSDQVKRAARSIPACIAEGHGRFTYKDQVHFFIISRGSATELLNHFIDAYDQQYISKEELLVQQKNIREVIKMLNGFIAFLKERMVK